MQKSFIPTDNITKELLNNYTRTNGKNYDVLIKIDNDKITARTLEQLIKAADCKINYSLYTTPTIFPWANNCNLNHTVFKDWKSSSFYENYFNDRGTIKIKGIAQNSIPLKDYIAMAKYKIEDNMLKILENSKNLILCYSRGIDSILLLSYLIKFNKVKDTRIVYCLNENVSNQEIDFSLEKKLGLDVEIVRLKEEDMLSFADQENPFKFYHYQSHWLTDKFKNHTLLVGHEGNSVLMHKWEWVKRLGKPVTKKDGYVTSCLDKIDWSINRNLEFDTISFIEPYSRSWNNPKEFGDVLSPISDIELIKLLPFVDILDADPNFFGDAELARSMIKDNVKDYLDTLIKSENENWVNFWNMGNINSNRLKEDTLKLDTHPRLNVNGIVYLRKVIEKAKTDGIIDVTALLSLKFNNYLVRNII